MAKEQSVTTVIVAVMVAIAAFGWAFMAGSYAGAHTKELSEMTEEERSEVNTPSGRRGVRRAAGRGILQFVFNAFEQLPNLPAVISWHFSNRIWLPITILVLEVLAFFGGIKMKALERELSKSRR